MLATLFVAISTSFVIYFKAHNFQFESTLFYFNFYITLFNWLKQLRSHSKMAVINDNRITRRVLWPIPPPPTRQVVNMIKLPVPTKSRLREPHKNLVQRAPYQSLHWISPDHAWLPRPTQRCCLPLPPVPYLHIAGLIVANHIFC
jgi:hypothetical protein